MCKFSMQRQREIIILKYYLSLHNEKIFLAIQKILVPGFLVSWNSETFMNGVE